MQERIILPLADQQPVEPTPEEIQAGIVKTEAFLKDVAPHLGRLFGMELNIQVGDHWATSLEPGVDVVTADPRFFIEKGFTPEMSSYATLHEVAAHLREKVTEPRLTDRVTRFVKQGQPQSIFHNIFADVAGNNLIHAVLPKMKDVAADLYDQKLFPETDFTHLPRHLQFLYKIIRQEMVPENEATVLPEVDEAIVSLRNFEGQGDVIKYSTAVAKSTRRAMSANERFSIWTRVIYPVYEELLEQDRADPEFQQANGQGPGKKSDQQNQSGEPSPTSDESDQDGFGSYYQDYRENRHPDPLDHEETDKLHQHAREKARERDAASSPEVLREKHEQSLNEKIKEDTGHTLRTQRKYNAEIQKWQSVIQEMRDVFQTVINQRVAEKRGLSRRTFAEGAVLDPDRLVQTVIDVRENIAEPEAFRDYEMKKGETRALGKTDYVFLFDASGSMNDTGKAEAAASSAVIGLEGLTALQRDIEQAEAHNDVDLDLDIRTAIFTFGDKPVCVKPLSTKVSPKERLDTYTAVSHPSAGSTQDFLALEELAGWEADPSRRRILIVVSDGESDGAQRARLAIEKLRGQDWFVYGISIGSDEAEELYKPTARRQDDPSKLPQTIYSFIEATIT